MQILTNPIIVSVVLLCVLCLLKMNVMFSLIIACVVGGLLGKLPLMDITSIMLDGFSANAEAAMAYVLLGTFASCLAYTGITDIFSKKIASRVKGSKLTLCIIMFAIAVISQTFIPIHTAFIPILIPPLLGMMNEMKMDRRLMAGALMLGMMPYIAAPVGYGLIFMNIVSENMVANGLNVSTSDVIRVNWMLILCFIPTVFYLWFRYKKPREYQDAQADLTAYSKVTSTKLTKSHYIALAAILVVAAVEVKTQSLTISAAVGLLVMFVTGAIRWKDIEDRFTDGIHMMGGIAFVMLVAGGFGKVMRATGGVETLVDAASASMSGSKLISATVIVLIGLIVTMGIGTSFGTVPVIAVIFVPLCVKLGFSPQATILMISAAGALGDAGSPASDATLGPTCGLNADGQHDHIWDTCVPTFVSFNLPLMLGTILIAQFL